MYIQNEDKDENMDELEYECRYGSYGIQDVLDVIEEQSQEARLEDEHGTAF